MRFIFRATVPLLLACLWVCLPGVAPGHAEKRVALVIGNDRYANLSANDQLQKAVNDARAVAGALRQIGFEEVIAGENLGRGALLGRLDELRQRVAPGDTAFFFFSGHGVALDGVNYILPADVPDVAAGQETRLKGEALSEQYIISELAGRGVRVAVVVLDACRTNPFGRSGGKSIGGEKGLAPPPQVKGVFSLYAASNGQAARDRLSDDDRNPNSVFSRVLVPALTRPGLDLTALAFDVREEVAQVAQRAGYVQEPAYYDGTIGGRVYLAGTPPAREQPPTREPPASRGPDAAQAWGAIQNTTSLAVLDEFIRQFGNSPFYGALARARREELAGEQARSQAAAAMPPAKPPAPAAAAPSQGATASVAPPVKPSVPPADPCSGPVTVSFPAGCSRDPIKIGILHSLSGIMAVNETTLKDVVLMLVDEQNKKGGLLGRKLEAVVVDPASNWPLFAEKARELIARDKVAAVFGGWTSVSRKSVLPVFKELNGILFYPVQYEGEESERNVFYTGAPPNQQAIPAVDYLMREEKVQRWVLEGTDYVYPRTTNRILEAYLKSKGVRDEDISINYTPFGHADWQARVAQIKRFGSAGRKTAVVSAINGDANVAFYRALANQGVKPTDIPVLALSVGEEELAGLDTRPLAGHLAAWSYFQSIRNPANDEFIRKWRAYTKNPRRTTNDPMEAHVIGFNMWVKAVEKAGTTDPGRVIDALPGVEAPNLTGGVSKMLPNHHITKPVFVGEVRSDGQFDAVWKTPGLVPGDAWSDYLPGSKDLEADWVTLKCGNYNTVTRKCGGP